MAENEKWWDAFKKNAKINAVVKHVERNKQRYLVGGAFVGGATIMYVAKSRPQITNITNVVAPEISPVFNNDNSSQVNYGGYATKIVKRLSDGKIFEEMSEAAQELSMEKGISLEYARQLISRNANQHTEHVFGDQYKFIGQTTTGS